MAIALFEIPVSAWTHFNTVMICGAEKITSLMNLLGSLSGNTLKDAIDKGVEDGHSVV